MTACVILDDKKVGGITPTDDTDVLIVCQNDECRWLWTVDYCKHNYLCGMCNTVLPIAKKVEYD